MTISATTMPAMNALAMYRVVSHTAASGSAPRTSKIGIQPRCTCSHRDSSAACGMNRKKPQSP